MNNSYSTYAVVRALYSTRVVALSVLLGSLFFTGGFKVVDRLATGQIKQEVFVGNSLAATVVDCGAFIAIMILFAGEAPNGSPVE